VYRDSTTLIVTCDHGRGGTLDDWHGHGEDVKGADKILIAVVGPDTPHRGEAVNTDSYYQREIAPTALELLGVGAGSYPGVLGKPIGRAGSQPACPRSSAGCQPAQASFARRKAGLRGPRRLRACPTKLI